MRDSFETARGELSFYRRAREITRYKTFSGAVQRVVALSIDVVVALEECKRCRRFACVCGQVE